MMKQRGSNISVLVIDDEPEIRSVLKDCLLQLGCEVRLAQGARDALESLKNHPVDVVFSDVHMPEQSGLQFLAECRKILPKLPAWVFITADASPETLLKAGRLGAVDTLSKPFDLGQISNLLNRLQERKSDAIREIMDLVQSISGVKLGPDKRLLVETRLMRRARILGLDSVAKYKEYFQKNREKEVDELISTMTTHTTSFFREPDHFDFLFDQVLPAVVSQQKPLRIWSAASSSGEEVYSLAISVLEYFREKNIPLSSVPSIEILGTDIDFHSVHTAQQGVYEFERVERLQAELIKRYFRVGTGSLSGFVRVNDEVHQLCRFEQMNLLSQKYPTGEFDVIFIRNVLIYFEPAQIKEIGTKLARSLAPQGFLFLGHSESFSGLQLPYKLAGNAVYQHAQARVLAPVPKAGVSIEPIRTLIVDDSLTVRKILSRILTREHGFQVVGEAANPFEADKILASQKVDLMTLDIHMPEMDGVTYLQKLKDQEHPPIVMISSISYSDAVTSLQCFELGAVDYIEKPQGLDLEQEAEKIRVVLKNASRSRQQSRLVYSGKSVERIDYRFRSSDLLLIGASTGGTEAIRSLLTQFPENSPPVLIVQHMPMHFSKAFAKRLDEICPIRVHEAIDGMVVEPGRAYIAPGGFQMKAEKVKDQLQIRITSDEPVNRHKPSVDYLFNSIIPLLGERNVSAALLTGMGNDGARGMKKLRESGAHTIAQNEETCVVFGMPKEAIAMGGAVEVLPLPSIAYHLFRSLRHRKAA